MSDIVYNYSKALRLFSEGIQLQMDYETLQEESPNEEQGELLIKIKESNERLYQLMKSLRKEL